MSSSEAPIEWVIFCKNVQKNGSEFSLLFLVDGIQATEFPVIMPSLYLVMKWHIIPGKPVSGVITVVNPEHISSSRKLPEGEIRFGPIITDDIYGRHY